ncbi:uncharacterized protein DUF1656 [Pseudomonas duriflava]|uniref:Uncharacterized protein DUF1656 n=1 Tax=Pseudomonas duriflava TaxID=459528 RepID=A0A562QG20_9PSED|nr:DUF1656 domain-containing protein [Pseudomonas duriflava]TWI55695.1 uncharacterized protein DUF1656 [Pseudomonas duriflava]
MELHEWSIGGVYLSPLFIYAVVALLLTGLIRFGMYTLHAERWIWHEALFGCAIFVVLLTVITGLAGT